MLEKSSNLPIRLVDADAPFSVVNADNIRFPLLLSVPHAGRDYPLEIKENLAVPASNLLRLEDRYADRLATKAVLAGFTTIIARKPRAWIDLNRSATEIDPDMIAGLKPSQTSSPSRKVRGGLGLIPRRLSGVGNLWRRKWDVEDIRCRISSCHEPYHLFVGKMLKHMREKFGVALLLDLHSMPPLNGEEKDNADIVIGDRFGRSAGSRYSELAIAFFEQSGFRARLNHPYAGGYMLDRHSDPQNGIHAIQLEIDRARYLDEKLREPGPGLRTITDHVAGLADMLTDRINGEFQLAAAE